MIFQIIRMLNNSDAIRDERTGLEDTHEIFEILESDLEHEQSQDFGLGHGFGHRQLAPSPKTSDADSDPGQTFDTQVIWPFLLQMMIRFNVSPQESPAIVCFATF